ncbi:MAG: sugar-transfer associated ATP-grasp domain-containing protein [Phycisphaerae bacterium]|nr:sugar-transfer associated ATP-grasp domain-containing protein [Phycisphaerae bacterium]
MPAEAFRLGLFRAGLPHRELSRYISRKKMTKIQEALNPVSWAPLLKDKSIFYQYCMASGVPIPKLYAVFLKGTTGWSCNGAVLRSREDWEGFFDVEVPSEFVVKPAQGAYGRGVNAFARTDGGFVDAFGRQYTTAGLYDMFFDAEDDRFVIQERLKNHPDLVRLSGTQSLQTTRYITLVDASGECHIVHAYQKVIIGGHVIDTFMDGLMGNVEAPASLADGVLGPASQVKGDGSGMRTMHAHPQTGVAISGLRVPLWREACKLVKETALKFLPIRTVGWDVSLTPDGPFIVEGNIWWDPPNQHPGMDTLIDALSRELQSSGAKQPRVVQLPSTATPRIP